MDFHPGKSGGGTSWGATLGAGGRGVMRAAAGGKNYFDKKRVEIIYKGRDFSNLYFII